MPDNTANFVKNTFTQDVSRTYELVNHVLTLGTDRIWRRKAARIAASHGGTEWADMCTGTGETAVYLSELAPEGTSVRAVDFSQDMIQEAARKPQARDIRFIISDVKALPFPDNSLDLITISFATRNINLNKETLTKTFSEFHRVLKPGGRFVNLETSQPSSAIIRSLYHLYIKLIVKPIGGLISGSYTGYAYLSHTMPRFYPPEELAEIITNSGFSNVSFEKMMFGAAAIHQGVKTKL